MDAKTLEHFKKLFLDVKKNYLDEGILKSVIPAENLTGDNVDICQGEREMSLGLKLRSRDNFFIKKVDHALLKINDGSFGECEECGEEISLGRLFARPTACLCISCKEEQERGEGHILYEKKSHTAGKKINFQSKNTNIVSFSELQKQKELKDKIVRFNEGRS